MNTTAPGKSNGAGKVSDLFAELATQGLKLPAVPVSDANVANAYALGWSVGDALTWCERQTSAHLTVVDGVDPGPPRWNLLIDQIVFQCTQLHA
jgi:hypothetical protein